MFRHQEVLVALVEWWLPIVVVLYSAFAHYDKGNV